MAYVAPGDDRRRRDGVARPRSSSRSWRRGRSWSPPPSRARRRRRRRCARPASASSGWTRPRRCRCTSTAPTPSIPELRLIKGAGGALAREKVVASASELFVCIVDESKLVERLGVRRRPPGAAAGPARRAADGGGARGRARARARRQPRRPPRLPSATTASRSSTSTGLDLSDPERLEAELDAIPGVVECGIFARRRADVVLVGADAGVRAIFA